MTDFRPTTGQCAQAVEEEVVCLYEANSAGLFRYAFVLARSREAAQDAVQEVFLRYFIERSAGRAVERPKAWLFQALRNLVFDMLKASRYRKSVELDEASDQADRSQNPEADCSAGEITRQLWAALSPRELECVRLRAEGLRYEEIAGVLGLRTGTVGALLARVQKKYRQATVKAPDRRRSLAGSEARYAP